MTSRTTAEHRRLEEARRGPDQAWSPEAKPEVKWRRWGTYLAERQWGTVREDYSADGNAWEFFPFEHASQRAYRWGEDGLLGVCDNRGLVCFAVALWNGADPILKERLFGLSGPEGNHGEDVKELYWYLDATPTCSYARALYKYPQRAFPYEELRSRSQAASRQDPEFEVLDTRAFAENRYFDVTVEYAKADVDDLLVRITVENRGPETAPLVVLPQLWFRNTWSWSASTAGSSSSPHAESKPELSLANPIGDTGVVKSVQEHLGTYWLYVEHSPELLFTENESNLQRLWQSSPSPPYAKGAFDDVIVHGNTAASNPARRGTKVGAPFRRDVAPGEKVVVRLRYSQSELAAPFADHDRVFSTRIAEADQFFDAIAPHSLGQDERAIFRQSIAGLLWSRQFYAYEVERWLRGDDQQPPPPPPPPAACVALARTQRALATPLQQRSLVDARQMGIPLVRRVGSRVSHDPGGPRGSRVRQAAAHAPRA